MLGLHGEHAFRRSDFQGGAGDVAGEIAASQKLVQSGTDLYGCKATGPEVLDQVNLGERFTGGGIMDEAHDLIFQVGQEIASFRRDSIIPAGGWQGRR